MKTVGKSNWVHHFPKDFASLLFTTKTLNQPPRTGEKTYTYTSFFPVCLKVYIDTVTYLLFISQGSFPLLFPNTTYKSTNPPQAKKSPPPALGNTKDYPIYRYLHLISCFFLVALRISDWTLQKRGVWICMTQGSFESPNHQFSHDS